MTIDLVDRRSEAALLLDHLDQTVHSGANAVVLVAGEAGVGKTRLLTHFSEQAAERFADSGLLVGYGQAMMNSLESDAFQAVRECLRSLTQSAQRSGSRELTNRVVNSFRLYAPDWIESVPVVGKLLAAGVMTGRNVIESGQAAPEMDSRLDQLVQFVADLVGRGPVLLILDDLHWADTATIDLLLTLALRVEGPLMLTLAYRPDDLQAAQNADSHPLRRAIYRLRRYSGRCAELDLPRLSRADTELLIKSSAGQAAVSTGFIDWIVAQSDGNPLFAESLFRVGSGGLRDSSAAGMPRQIKAILEERLSFLPTSDQRLLESAALIGYSFEVAYLAALTRMDIDDVYERMDVLLNEYGLVRPADPRGDLDRYTIHHPLLAEVLRERGSVNAPRWRRQHHKLLEILEREEPWDDEVAVRAVAVAVGAENGARARELALSAGRRQFELGAITKARQLAQVAIEHGQDSADLVTAQHLLAECLSAEADHIGAARASAEAMRWARNRPVDQQETFAVKLLWARSLRMTGRWDECAALLSELEAESRAADASPVLAEVRMLEAEVALCGPVQDPDECVRLCSIVYDMTSDPALQARALGHRGLAYLAGYDPDSAEVWLNRAIEVAREKDHPYAEYEAIHWLSKKTIACLELDRAWGLLEELARTSDISGVASESPFHLRDSSRVLALRGLVAESAAAFARYFDSCLPHAMDRATTTLACQIHELETLFDRGAADDMLSELARATTDEITDPDRGTRLAAQLAALLRRRPGWTPVAFAVEDLMVDRGESGSADAIFRFDVPDLAALRARVRPPV